MATKKKTSTTAIDKALAKAQAELVKVKEEMKTTAQAARVLYKNHTRIHALYGRLKKRKTVLEARIYNLKMKKRGKA
jgi:ribosomal protein S5